MNQEKPPATPAVRVLRVADRHSGYQVGGTSPFGAQGEAGLHGADDRRDDADLH